MGRACCNKSKKKKQKKKSDEKMVYILQVWLEVYRYEFGNEDLFFKKQVINVNINQKRKEKEKPLPIM